MKWTSVNDLREKFLSFFESKGHLRRKSFSLVPVNDKSILLINAGMTPLKKYFTGEVEPPRKRMTTCQKCIRTPDIDRVGMTSRHGTYFEMLGNFSFGDYFKHEAITWAWEFCTKVLELPVEKLWVTIYQDDDEAFEIWNKVVGVEKDRIVRLGKEDNFWEHGAGPCGPCSEIHFDRGPEFGCGSPDCKPGCDCDRFMEFWNLVFTQFDSDGKGTYTRLKNPNIDTGMGLERLACIMQGVNNLFEIDTVKNIMNAVCEKAGIRYGDDPHKDISLRVITDHIRSSTFLIGDGVVPSNEGRGYVLRRLLRRAARHGKMLGIDGVFLTDICEVVARENITEYPELTEKLPYIKKVLLMEEERFAQTIDTGLSILSEMLEKVKAEGKETLSGDDVFKLYDTFGFPIDLTREIAGEQGIKIDEVRFKELMTEQRQRARGARANIGGWSESSKNLLKSLPKTKFLGYTDFTCEAKVLSIIVDDMEVDRVTEGDFTLVLDKTVFYGEGGGQIGDTGKIYRENSEVTVLDTKKSDDVYIHLCTSQNCDIKVGDVVRAELDADRRRAIMRNHSATHLLQAALRKVLGSHVEQAGSHVTDEYVRFDFTHFAPLTKEEISKVEMFVNEQILLGNPIQVIETDIESAKKQGALALFDEKYGSVVRVIKMGDFSTELCGGTHLDNTAKAGMFKIVSESSVAAGIRRIEATTGTGVLRIIDEKDRLISETARELKAQSEKDIIKRATAIQAELKEAKRQIESLNAKISSERTKHLQNKAVNVSGVTLVCDVVDGATVDMLRNMCDELKSANSPQVILLASAVDGKINFVCSCTKEAVTLGLKAGDIVRQVAQITGGGGGGRPDFATAGGKDASKLASAINSVAQIVENSIKK